MMQEEREYILEANQWMESQQWEKAVSVIYEGISCNNRSYELYFMLAQCKEMLGQMEQAALSYQNALFFSNEEDYEVIASEYEAFLRCAPGAVHGVSIVLVTYNQLEMTKWCVESIRRHVPGGCYEIIVVDNLSTDGTREWLKKQEDIKCVLNEENMGFPAACNQGAALAREGNDIFLLNNDTILMENSVYNLHMALYESEDVGAAGASSNAAGNGQQIKNIYPDIEGYIAYASENNCYHPSVHEKKVRLIGFAMMVRRKIWEQVGGFDEIYGLGYYEDDDLSLKILTQGKNLVFCRDSFIFHFGGASFQSVKKKRSHEYQSQLLQNKKKLEQKWGIVWGEFSHARLDLLSYIEEEKKKAFSVLEIGCVSGATLLEIQNLYPNAKLYGLEINTNLVKIASHYLNVRLGDIREKQNYFETEYDYIVMGDILEELENPEEVLKAVKEWLKPSGHLVISVRNRNHISALAENDLSGRELSHEDSGERVKHSSVCRLFTGEEMVHMLDRCGLLIERMGSNAIELSDDEEKKIRECQKEKDALAETELRAFQYRIKAVRKG